MGQPATRFRQKRVSGGALSGPGFPAPGGRWGLVSPPPRSGGTFLPAATALSAPPAPGSAAEMVDGTSVSRRFANRARKRRLEKPPFHAGAMKAVLEVLALCDQV